MNMIQNQISVITYSTAFENVSKFKFLRTTLTKKNEVYYEIKR
jgi:hypothetical protein